MRATYNSIYFELKDAIIQGKYPYQDFLPSEAVLVKHFDCAHNTVRKALLVLSQEGYVQPIHGKGVRVIYRPDPVADSPSSDSLSSPNYPLNHMEPFLKTAERHGFEAGTKAHVFETVIADKKLAWLTGFEEGSELLHIERTRFYDGLPLERESNYFRSDIVAGITQADAEHSVYNYIEVVLHKKLVTRKRNITIQKANADDYKLLAMNDASYVAIVTNHTFDGNGLLCEATIARIHPDAFSLYDVEVRSLTNSWMN